VIVIASTLFDPMGYLSVDPLPSTATQSFSRRVSRVGTTDGGVAISDRGYSDGDRTLQVEFKPSRKEENDRALRFVRLHSTVRVGTEEGVFSAVAESFNQAPDTSTLTLLLIEKLTED